MGMSFTADWNADCNVRHCTWYRSTSRYDEKCRTCDRSNQMTPASASPGWIVSPSGSLLRCLARSRCHARDVTSTRSPSANTANTTAKNYSCQLC